MHVGLSEKSDRGLIQCIILAISLEVLRKATNDLSQDFLHNSKVM
jgi:hypothetical protein